MLVVFLMKWETRSNFPPPEHVNKNNIFRKKNNIVISRAEWLYWKKTQLSVVILLNIFCLKAWTQEQAVDNVISRIRIRLGEELNGLYGAQEREEDLIASP